MRQLSTLVSVNEKGARHGGRCVVTWRPGKKEKKRKEKKMFVVHVCLSVCSLSIDYTYMYIAYTYTYIYIHHPCTASVCTQPREIKSPAGAAAHLDQTEILNLDYWKISGASSYFIQVLSYFSRIDRYPLIVPLPLLDSHSPFLFLLLSFFFFFFFSPPLSAPLSPAPLSKVPPPLNAAIIPYLSIM